MQGRVLTLGQTHGYGFIEAESGGDYFFHASAVCGGIPIENLRAGDRVVFEPTMTVQGPGARAVRRAVLNGIITGLQHENGPGGGYGFLRPLTGGDERFFHFSRLGASGLAAGDLFGRLRVGELVSYRESPGNRGQRARAVDVVPLSPPHTQKEGNTPMDQQSLTDGAPVRRDGTITHLLCDRGFGFIAPRNSRESLFFHAREMRDGSFDELRAGTRLTFVEGVDRNGRPCAVDVCVLDDDTAVA